MGKTPLEGRPLAVRCDDWTLVTPSCKERPRKVYCYLHVKDDLQEFPKTNSSQWPMSNSSLGVVVFGPLKDKENIEYIKGVIRIRKPKKDRQ